jgi:hypothetical protein
MELILSNVNPAKISNKNQKDFWNICLSRANILKIATGYITVDSIVELTKIIEINSRPKIELLIGMHYFDLFTKPQYDAVLLLNEILLERGLGEVYLSNKRRFHGKMYSFIDGYSNCKAIVGSSNLASAMGVADSLYEVDCFFEKRDEAIAIDETISKLIKTLGVGLKDLPQLTEFNSMNMLLDNHYGVIKVSAKDYADILSKRTNVVFELPVKSTDKSNLNVFFGKGREDKRGFVMPRPWYEVELIVSKKITENENYPKNRTFTVITNDLWSFECFTNGDAAKNLRSKDDLKILGKWVKGKLEQSGALKVGHPVTQDVIRTYGRDTISLIGTTDPNIWLLEF